MPPHGVWTTETLRGHLVEIFEPARRTAEGGVVLFLHDQQLRSLRELPYFLEPLARLGVPVIAPQCGPTWWVDRKTRFFERELTPRQFVVECVKPFAQQRWSQPPHSPVALLGNRMGGQGALGLAYRYPDQFPIVAAITPTIDFQLLVATGDEVLCDMYEGEEEARQDTVVLHIHPLNWPRHQFFCCDPADPHWFPGVDRLRMKLWSLGVPHECDLESTATTPLEYEALVAESAITFLGERLDQERRRIA